MSRWKELPAELHPHVHQLIVRLRRLKDHSELSARQLADRTGYSAKSWQRYLNGRSLPPREAVEAMARVGGDDPHRLLVMHEVAAQRWAEGRVVTPDAPEDFSATPAHTPTERQPYGRHLRAAVMAGAVVTVLSVSAALLLAVRLTEARAQLARDRGDAVAAAPATVSESLVPVIYTCRLEQRDGRWYAGLSRTTDIPLSNTHVGLEVAEAQCLLRRAGTAPGEIDGVFGPKTRRAVERMQKRSGLVVDGVIGPRTWRALREAASE
ncbi:peptidoglycan-binding protein [Streptomyces sp. 378]|uniref:peptidoglycan-binding protein n=1 Tax=Streptomyces sp. 378 TaxID=3049412 RepID=UPI0024C2DF12|nr:peptidoglycan-binding protein [Streptomyces sp. 378]MDK1346385.1 peptidoglycan-binding protein [Streptomyces sp. 378]